MSTPLVLVEKAIEEIALHGRQGCSLQKVWSYLKLSQEQCTNSYKTYILNLLKKRPISFSDNINSSDEVERDKTICVASKTLRFRALGYEDATLQGAYFEDPYLKLLERIGASKKEGVSSPVLATMLNLDNGSMHFQMQCLVSAGLVSIY